MHNNPCPICNKITTDDSHFICPKCSYRIISRKRFNLDSNQSLPQFLRSMSSDWVKLSRKHGNSTCLLTGATKRIDVHHATDFRTLYDILLSEVGLIKNYPEGYHMYFSILNNPDVKKKITKIWLNILFEHGLGICLSSGIHRLFHRFYGRKEILPHHLETFKESLEEGHYSPSFICKNGINWLSDDIPIDVMRRYATRKPNKSFYRNSIS